MPTMTGPRKINDLDLTLEQDWEVDSKSTHIYQDRLWSHVTAGCVLCVEAERNDASGQTLQAQDDEHIHICLTHGQLDEVQYKITRDITITIDNISHKGTQDINDIILIPRILQGDERISLIKRLMGIVVADEAAKDVLDD